MNMVYCRGCGGEIHQSAKHCPHCGSPQTAQVPAINAEPGTDKSSSGLQITSFVLALILLLVVTDAASWDEDTEFGFWCVQVITVCFAVIGLTDARKTKVFGVLGLVIAGIAAMAALA